ncbi:hypothetical protein AXG93_1881s1480 [Marchantia polymorpha subsp. ruderalis]|uniref:Plus3 domain-containing protein n=1 Tax=Marchantia polymorpha subsp. ruderalis TaxID=1480154 RepID=A0A176W6V1_MARPO|nr:hypothetical protein AXG93_1881s1480 [Marchantia polymorpha subsp. ruderalis]
MADSLEDMLLEAAGRSKGGHGDFRRRVLDQPPKSRRLLPNTSGKSDKDFDDVDQRGRRSTKPHGSTMPVKKWFDFWARTGRDAYDSDTCLGSDLYEDDEDRARLAEIDELDREMILYERAEARDSILARKDARAHLRQVGNTASNSREGDLGPPSSRIRSSSRECRDTSKTSKFNALRELVQRRLQAHDCKLRKRYREVPEVQGCSSMRQTRNRSYLDSNFIDDDSDSSTDDDDDDQRIVGSDHNDDVVRKSEPDADWQDIKSITVQRSRLYKWFMEPFFEDVIVGCFVRIGIGVSRSGQRFYRLCSVKNVDATAIEKRYMFENQTTHKYLNLVWGDERTAARWQMARASDQPPTQREVLELLREIDRCGGKKPSKADVREKKEALAKISSFVYSPACVKQMIQEKRSSKARPSNFALEKIRIVGELAAAESEGNDGEINRLQARLRELEELSTEMKTRYTEALALEEMNRKNKIENLRNASQLRPLNRHAKPGKGGYDSLYWRSMRSKNYNRKDGPKDESIADGAEDASGEFRPDATSPKGRGLSKTGVAESTPHELHNFDLKISLAPLQQPAPRAYMARKQKLEALYSVPIENSDDGSRSELKHGDLLLKPGS